MVNFYYESARGEVVNFHDVNGLWANENALRGYEWEYEIELKTIRNLSLRANDKTFPAVFFGTNAAQKRNAAYKIFDRDVRNNTPGRLYVGEWYLHCFIISAEDVTTRTNALIRSDFGVVSADGKWRNEYTVSYTAGAETPSDGMDYPYDYPYDYAARRSGAKTIENPFEFASDFLLTIYGPASIPAVTIGGHMYKINDSILSGERIEIDSSVKTITHYSVTNTAVNWFNKRYKPESIFYAIPAGVVSLEWDGTFGFDVTLYGERSEPPFDEAEDNVPDNAYVCTDGTYILADGSIYKVTA